MNEDPPTRARRRRRRQADQRALLRALSHVTTRLEQTREYRASLQRVLELGGELQATLDPAQRECWLALEDALFDHSSRLHRAYFRAGMEHRGKRLAASVSTAETLSAGPAGAREIELLLALARWLGKLLQEGTG